MDKDNQVDSENDMSLKDELLTILETTKAINSLPSGSARDSYCAYPTFGKSIDHISYQVLKLMSKILKHQTIKGNIERRQQEEQFEMILECNDLMLERINSNLDKLAFPKSNKIETSNPVVANVSSSAGSWNSKVMFTPERIFTTKNIIRPQTTFTTPIDNSQSIFEPKIKYKPNSLKPLAILPEYDDYGNVESYLHPYEYELRMFTPSREQLITVTSIHEPKSLDSTDFLYIDTKQQLESMIDELKNKNEVGVDLEHHSYRSFQGLTCLMQLSSVDKDYVIDTIKLRDELNILNEIFTNSNIVKIFHGADLDIEWLQRDLGLYVVNMFDTHQAAKILQLPRLSLAFLLKLYCKIDVDKTYQLADWRLRPLPIDYICYARQDTHYLIYLYKVLTKELLNKGRESNLLLNVYERSKELCEKRYVKPRITEDSYMDLYRKSKRNFDNRQIFALKEIFQWRDQIARKEDESYGYVLPNHMMLQISETLPREMQGILACCNPIPPLVRQNLHLLHSIILKAKEQLLINPIINKQFENRIVPLCTTDLNNKLNSSYDFSYEPEFRDDLPTVLDSLDDNPIIPTIIIGKPTVPIFDFDYKLQESIMKKLTEIKKIKFIGPYERYKAIIEYLKDQPEEIIDPKPKEKNNITKTDIICPVPEKKSLKRKLGNSITDTQATTTNKIPELKKIVSKIEPEDQIQKKDKPDFKKKQSLPVVDLTKEIKSKSSPYDYKSTDYRQFKGGARKTVNTGYVSKHHNKGNKNRKSMKQLNKLFTFKAKK